MLNGTDTVISVIHGTATTDAIEVNHTSSAPIHAIKRNTRDTKRKGEGVKKTIDNKPPTVYTVGGFIL